MLFRQQRAGWHGATFELVKFRTMRTAEPGDDGPDVDEARPRDDELLTAELTRLDRKIDTAFTERRRPIDL